MLISFAELQLRTEANSLKLLTQKYGDRKARRVRQRLDELDAIPNLEELRTLPALYCVQVKAYPASIVICTVRPSGILFQVDNMAYFDGTILNWRKVTTIKIISLDENAYE